MSALPASKTVICVRAGAAHARIQGGGSIRNIASVI
jgi:hypothetical protein